MNAQTAHVTTEAAGGARFAPFPTGLTTIRCKERTMAELRLDQRWQTRKPAQ